jgi:uncharacterized surface protein with fasciclin (FAS1) repeats
MQLTRTTERYCDNCTRWNNSKFGRWKEVTDANGVKSTVILADVAASNGVIHAIDTVVIPK